MPLFYNTAFPTPTTKNTINDITVGYGIRDFLLNLNLLPQYPQIPTNINGSPRIGEPVLNTTVGTGNVIIPIGLPLETNGIIWKDLNVVNNIFQNDPNVVNNLEQIDYIPPIPNPDFTGAIWPTNSQYPTGANPQVEQYGIKGKTEIAQYRRNNVIRNLYLDTTSQIDMADFIGLQPLNISQQLGNYLDVFGGINQGGVVGDQVLNVIGSILNGQGVGLGSGGSVIPNFDFKSSLAGRVLGGTGFIKDTKLGNVGAQQLALALANNAAFNVQQEILGSLNVRENIYSLIKDGELAGFRANYKITVPSSTGGQILNGVTRVLGFQIPRSYLDDAGSIFQTENGDAGNINRANSMIENTGKGQVKSLIKSMLDNLSVNSNTLNPFRSGYSPGFIDKNGESISGVKLYAFSYSSGQGTINGDINKILGNSGDVIPQLNFNREAIVEDSGFKSPEQTFNGPLGNLGYDNRNINQVGFTWTTGNGEAVNRVTNFDELDTTGTILDKKSLLVKTQKLFNSKGMKTLVSVKGVMGQKSSQIQSSNNSGISKGSGVLSKNNYDLERGVVAASAPDAEGTFCRSWTTLDRYDKIKNLIRNKSLLNDPENPYRFKTQNTVLDGPFVKITPYSGENNISTDPKNFMFSIENLAWKDEWQNLPECEKGPGDLISGEKGRIMWFPPYDIQFNESSSVNWEETNFIGRGEPLYSYNNTKRTGQLSFKVIVDHPSYYNAFRGQNGPDDNYIASFFAGCVDTDTRWVDKLLGVQTADRIKSDKIETPQVRQNPTDPIPPTVMKIYYPNDIKDYEPIYEDGKCGVSGPDIDYQTNSAGFGCGLNTYTADVTWKDVKGVNKTWSDRYDYGLNVGRIGSDRRFSTDVNGSIVYGYNDVNYSINMINFLKEYPWAVVNIQGFASPQGNPSSNTKLANLRAQTLRDKLINDWGGQLGLPKDKLEKRFKILKGKALTKNDVPDCIIESKENPDPPVDTLPCKLARRVEITVTFDANLKAEYIKSLEPKLKRDLNENTRLNSNIRNKFYTECDYFEKLAGDNTKFIFDSIREKIRYFHPAFHSITPEGLNSRLTFLLQCTRQGKTLENLGANNLAFGRPPVCILRIGDFYNTKIIMDSVNISYEPLIWDLNPEGVGVQPMLANVDITFSFLGGSSLMGPINKLQNALSFNYFANTHVYDPRADYISKDKVNLDNENTNNVSVNNSNTTLDSLTDYYINDGINYSEYIRELENKTEENFSETNQFSNQLTDELNLNKGLSNNQNETPSILNSDDKQIVNNIIIVNYLKFNTSEDIITLVLAYNKKFDIPLNLNHENPKTYKGQIYLINGITKINIGFISVTSNGLNNGVIFKSNSGAEILISPNINNQTFNIVLIFENETISNNVKELYNKKDTRLKLEWETGGSSQCNFNNNNGI